MIAKEAEAIAGYWADIGINAEIAPIDFGAYWPKFNAIETVGECFTYRLLWTGDPNPFTMLAMLDRNAGWGFAYQCEASEIYTPMAEAAIDEMDLSVRDGMYREITQVIYDNTYLSDHAGPLSHREEQHQGRGNDSEQQQLLLQLRVCPSCGAIEHLPTV